MVGSLKKIKSSTDVAFRPACGSLRGEKSRAAAHAQQAPTPRLERAQSGRFIADFLGPLSVPEVGEQPRGTAASTYAHE